MTKEKITPTVICEGYSFKCDALAVEIDKEEQEPVKEPLYKTGKLYGQHFDKNGNERTLPRAKAQTARENSMADYHRMMNQQPQPPHNSPPPLVDTRGERLPSIETEDHFNPPPVTPENAFPPSLQSAVNAACNGTEAQPMAVALHYAVYFAAHVGQHRYIRIGNGKHPLSFCGILVGRTGKVKGTAETQAECIERAAVQQLIEQSGYVPPRRLSGLSSGEGLIQAIRDPVDEEDDKGVLDKRLLITESEYANVLSQDQRSGNTLSMVLRGAFDGKDLANATVTPRVATRPHISIIGHITPGELKNHKSFVTQSINGSLNRNLIFFSKREGYSFASRQYTREELEGLSQWFADSIYRARDQEATDNYTDRNAGKEMVMSQEALSIIQAEYEPRERAQDAMPEVLANMVSRHRVFVWRLSAILALMDSSDVIQAEHVQQAYKWLDYSLDSIRYLLSTAKQEAEQEEVNDLAEEVYQVVCSLNNEQGCSKTEISNHFSRKKTSSELTAALQSLMESVPAKVEVWTPEKKGTGRRKTMYRAAVAKKAN